MAYYNGDGVEKNTLKASQWLRLAVKQNFSEAQYSLGLLLLEGDEGISKNTIEGLALVTVGCETKSSVSKGIFA
jgi:TPR repeat protein